MMFSPPPSRPTTWVEISRERTRDVVFVTYRCRLCRKLATAPEWTPVSACCCSPTK